VLGSLVEKHLTTPQQYPLTINALVTACNQATNRDPVVYYGDAEVLSAVDELKQARLARSVLPSHGRSAVRYRHVLDETLALNATQCALFAVLLLRGPQTLAELRTRTDRMAEFADLAEVERELEWLAARDEPLTVFVGRKPGQKEDRWGTPVVERIERVERVESSERTERSERSFGERVPEASLADLEAQVAALHNEVAALRVELHELRTSLGD
jgi:uncharacterized protein YceH (UPF0502 family)